MKVIIKIKMPGRNAERIVLEKNRTGRHREGYLYSEMAMGCADPEETKERLALELAHCGILRGRER